MQQKSRKVFVAYFNICMAYFLFTEHVEGDCIFARSQGLLLLASLLKERTVIRSLWNEQRELLTSLLYLIQQALQSNETGWFHIIIYENVEIKCC